MEYKVTFNRKYWAYSEFCYLLEEKKDLPPITLQPRGSGFIARYKVDADHAAENVTRKSISRLIVCINYTPLVWFRKMKKIRNPEMSGKSL